MAAPHDALPLEHRPAGAPATRPLRDAFHLPARDTSVALARARVLERLREWYVDDESNADAQLLMSELFTNAVRHTDSEKVSCELWVIGVRLRLEVADEGGGASVMRVEDADRGRVADDERENGRGLLLVSVLADDWGIRKARTSGSEGTTGHAVWAELECHRTHG
ncbi:ATP-binding protein [Streptomyces sp. 891-h]|uniref:ATP-binding protein n=1 Tax=Streptomyces sp. 891-h TaxID=2720714 RepID=UPI00204653C3|nr:ATP-binding protein [Streptomyces sp. 891-h]UNZ16215.1 ATP-binding protein [Streptomyces sp. 891-h]